MGTFQRLASSGSSSSESWYSSSRSFNVFRLGCHEPLRFSERGADGDKARLWADGDEARPGLLWLGRNGEVERDRRGFRACNEEPGSNLL